MTEDLYGIRKADVRDYRDLIRWWRTTRGQLTYEAAPVQGAYPFVCLRRPTGWSLGLCRELIHDAARPFVWDVSLVGYPALTGRTTFQLRWTKGSEVLTSDPIAVTARADQLAKALPEGLPEAYVYGGRMRATGLAGDAATEYDTGRWWLAFSEDPVWTPEVIGLTSDRLAGFARRTHLRPSPEPREFFTLASTGGPTPVQAGAMGVGFPVGGRMCMLYHEPRVWQGTLEAATTAGINWSLGPFQQEVTEGNNATVTVTLSIDAISTLTGPATTSVDFTWDAGPTTGDDFDDTLADWIATAVAGSDTWEFDGTNRLTANIAPDGPSLLTLDILVPVRDDGVLEGLQTVGVQISNPLSSEASAGISLERADINIRDADSVRWDLTGPAASSPGSTETMKLVVSGILSTGLFTSIDLVRTGSVADENTTDWEDALATVAAARAELAYSAGTLTVTAQSEGPIDPIEFDVGYNANADGSWTLTISDAGSSGGLDVEIGQETVTTEVSP